MRSGCCARRERPRRNRAAEQGDEAAPSQLTKFHQVAAIRKARSIPKGGDQVRDLCSAGFRPARRPLRVIRVDSRFGGESACPPISGMSGSCQIRRDVP